ncbi:hypothetical protein EBR57_06960, partial [bacterium]|nr:hypothetical protein [bacterium]
MINKLIAVVIGIISVPIEWFISRIPISGTPHQAVVRMDQIGDFLLSRGFISAVIEADPTTVLIIN